MEAEIKKKSEEMLEKKIEEEQAAFYSRDYKRALIDLGSTF